MSNPPAPVELQRVLAAAAQVQRELGCAINIHPAWFRAGARGQYGIVMPEGKAGLRLEAAATKYRAEPDDD